MTTERLSEIKDKIPGLINISNFIEIADTARLTYITSYRNVRIKNVTLTEIGRDVLNIWLKLHNRIRICPFFGTCSVCEEIFPYYHRSILGRLIECPCYKMGEVVCEKAALLLLENKRTSVMIKFDDEKPVEENKLRWPDIIKRLVQSWRKK